MKLGIDYIQLAMHLGNDITPSQVEENIRRIRPVLKDSLSKKWCDPVPACPRPLAESPFPQVALIVDSHTTPCFCPKAPFEEATIYFNGKNKVYGLKSE